jgi:hypothetical protein
MSNGQNVDIWTLSLTSFTCLYTVVTGKLVIWTRWWTKVSIFFYSVMSIMVYIAYVWFSNYWSGSSVIYSVIELHMSPLFWLSVMLVGGAVFLGDLLIEHYRLETNPNGSDFARILVEQKRGSSMFEYKQKEMPKVKVTSQDMKYINKLMEPIE